MIPKNLITALNEKKLIPIVGAGVSMSLKSKSGDTLFLSWKELLLDSARRLTEEDMADYADAVRAMVKINEYENAADMMRKGLHGSLWNQFFQEKFNIKETDIDSESFNLSRSIWKLGSKIITLNYDKTLRFSCPDQSVTELVNSTTSGLRDFIKTDNYKIWHLHGNIDNTNEIIFTTDSYNDFYNQNVSKYEAALDIFQQLCRDVTFIFIGCSVDDALLLAELQKQHTLFGTNTGPHYVLCKESHYDSIYNKINHLPFKLITFKDFGQPLIDLVEEIGSTKTTLETDNSSSYPNKIISDSNPRVALLISSPLDKSHDHTEVISEIKKFKAEISVLSFSFNTLNNLENYDYIFIVTRNQKNKILIEDEYLIGKYTSLKEIEENIYNETTKGILYFFDYNEESDIDTKEFEHLTLPSIILPSLNKNQMGSVFFKIFKKRIFDAVEGSFQINISQFETLPLAKYTKVNVIKTDLPLSIDPRTIDGYVGRKTDLENICRKIFDIKRNHQFLNIKGSGGIGKTITLKKIVTELSIRNYFPDGIDFIDCEFIEDYNNFEDKISQCFNLNNALKVKEQIKEKYSHEDRLIMLDNMETLIHLPISDEIKNLISFLCEYVTIVITSRENLDIDAENVYELRPFTTDEGYKLFINEISWIDDVNEVDKKIIRSEILEELLDNNPLAIKLITKNIPKGKDFGALKKELESNFFTKVSTHEIETFDKFSDINIERKRSLYGSINFSYQFLTHKEKVAFELLSLFPDGIKIENFKKLAEEIRNDKSKNSSKSNHQKIIIDELLITDPIIKSLDNKSLIQINNSKIRLQSIIGKFASWKLKQRNSSELEKYYKNAFDYNYAMAYKLHTSWQKNNKAVVSEFNNTLNNFISSIRYLQNFNINNTAILRYLDHLHLLTIEICANANLAQVLEDQKFSFEIANDQLCFDMYILSLRYYAGEFEHSYMTLKKIVPLTSIKNFDYSVFSDSIIVDIALQIYAFEGEISATIDHESHEQRDFDTYPLEFH